MSCSEYIQIGDRVLCYLGMHFHDIGRVISCQHKGAINIWQVKSLTKHKIYSLEQWRLEKITFFQSIVFRIKKFFNLDIFTLEYKDDSN